MSFANYSIHHNFILASVAGNYAAGTVLVQTTTGDFVIATSANRTLYNRKSAGLMRTAGDGTRNMAVDVQVCGLIPAAIANVGTGTSGEWVRVSATGFLERVTSPGGSDDVVGKADGDGNVQCLFGGLVSTSAGGGGDSPGTPDKSLQYRVNATTFGGDAYWTREAAGRLNATYFDPIDGVTVRSILTVGDPANTFPAFGFMRVAQQLATPGSITLISYHDGTTGRAALGLSGGILFLGDTGITNETQVYGTDVTITAGTSTTAGGFTVSRVKLGSLTGSAGVASVNSSGAIRRSLGSGSQYLRTNSGATDIEWATLSIVNADVNAAAAIAGTKISPDFGSQDITTTGNALIGATPRATTGTIRLPNTGSLWFRRADNGANIRGLALDGSNFLYCGDGVSGFAYWELAQASGAARLVVWNGSSFANQLRADGQWLYAGVPILGDSNVFSVHGKFIKSIPDSNYTLTSTEYNRQMLQFDGTPTATRTITWPHPTSNDNAYGKDVYNNTGQTLTMSTGTGTTLNVTSGSKARIFFSTAGVISIGSFQIP